MGNVLPLSFFSRPVLAVAPEILGKMLVAPKGEGIITEVEAYDGPQDCACHGRFGKTTRTAVMFGPAGVWYVYLCYGMHFMLNIVTGDVGYPAAVLIRGVGAWGGPGKVTRAFGIDHRFNGMLAEKSSGLFIEDRGFIVPPHSICRTPRIGVEYAGKWHDAPYRFLFLSKGIAPKVDSMVQ